ncbi:MAG: imidazolonepropionase [Lewinellaceae bacterium]|nr:imidazolonepropionase [Lewinellaceae bacterium]
MANLLIRNIKGLVLAVQEASAAVRGKDMAQLPVLENAWLLVENDTIHSYGSMPGCPERADTTLDANDRFVFPSWCDSHTHLVFAASREEEFVSRIKGLSYEDIAAQGGGILNSARKLQSMPAEQLLESAWNRLEEIIGYGTGMVEIKSGYGLTLDSELKMLRVIRELKKISPIPIKATFLGAHAMPAEFKTNREGYLKLVIDEMLPKIAAEGLADYCDVFCERGFYSVEETDRILKAAAQYGLKPRIHANQMHYSGGVQVGIANQAISVDHLEHCGAAEIAALQHASTFPTLLPSCSFFLGLPYAPARDLIDAGLPVVLATDFNPGSTPSGRMPFVLSLACIHMKMLPEEAIHAATINGAAALEMADQYGSITPGKIANLMISKPMSSIAFLPYAFGTDPVERVILAGKEWNRNQRQ